MKIEKCGRKEGGSIKAKNGEEDASSCGHTVDAVYQHPAR